MEKVVIIENNSDYLCEIKSILRDTFFNSQILTIFNYRLSDDIISDNTKKLYIIEVDRNKLFLNTIERIRKYDWDSIIIIISKYKKYGNVLYSSSLMIFSYIYYDLNFIVNFSNSIRLVNKVIENKYIFVFKYKCVIYRIFYSDINYIEKEPQVKRCIIHTVYDEYYIVNSIERLTKVLGNGFVKTHQSCIINTSNVERINLAKNLIIFKNGDETSLLSDSMKKGIKKLELLK